MKFSVTTKPMSAEEAATVSIRHAILRGSLVPGQRLAQAEMAAQLGVSRIPLRDALRRLDGDLVTIDGRRGCWVSSLDANEIAEIYEIRIALEPRCVRLAVERLTEDDAQYLCGLAEDMDLQHSEALSGYETRRTFYAELYSYADRPRMTRLILQLRDNVGRYHVLQDVQHSVDAHGLLRRQIMERDPEGAVEVMVGHLVEARDDLLATMVSEEPVAKADTEGL
jgi:DNA-binding GntR family transcriptional regulator